jgi:hypothetical protein
MWKETQHIRVLSTVDYCLLLTSFKETYARSKNIQAYDHQIDSTSSFF